MTTPSDSAGSPVLTAMTITCANGTLDPLTLAFAPGEVTGHPAAGWDPEARAPEFERILTAAMSPEDAWRFQTIVREAILGLRHGPVLLAGPEFTSDAIITALRFSLGGLLSGLPEGDTNGSLTWKRALAYRELPPLVTLGAKKPSQRWSHRGIREMARPEWTVRGRYARTERTVANLTTFLLRGAAQDVPEGVVPEVLYLSQGDFEFPTPSEYPGILRWALGTGFTPDYQEGLR